MILRIASVISRRGAAGFFLFFKKMLKLKEKKYSSGKENSDWRAMAVRYDIACQA